MSALWSETVHRLVPYVPGEQRAGPDIVKLNTNENPYPPSAAVLQAIAQVDGDALRRYPDAESIRLRDTLAAHHGLRREQVFVGNGSDEILAFAFLAFFTGRGRLHHPSPSYSFYPVYCGLYGIESDELALSEQDGFALDPARFALDVHSAGVILPNPNAPTGRAIGLPAIQALLQRCPDRVVLIDEAYADFGADSAVALIDRHPNLLVSRTFSKGRSLAGLRLGVALGDAALIEALQRVKNSFNSYPVDAVAQAAGIASLQDEATYRDQVARIVATRERFTEALHSRGWTVLPSAANFVFAQPSDEADEDGPALAARLSAAGVLVRRWSLEPIARWLRISIGTDADMDRLLTLVDDPDRGAVR